MDKFLTILVGALALVLLFAVTVRLPIELMTERDCLEKGYPAFKVDVFLKGYCLNIDGYTTGVVEPVSKAPEGLSQAD